MKRTHIILIVLIAVAIGVIISTVGDSSSYENFSTAAANPDREYHVVGTLARIDQMEYNPEQDANLFKFYLEDNNGEVNQVVFYGTKPQDFERSEQVVIVGQMTGEAFTAHKILTKCPSKYTEDEIEIEEYNAVKTNNTEG
ncbi:MAG: cytochrome c maturation protein CcmE [Bacteroidia bacterium]